MSVPKWEKARFRGVEFHVQSEGQSGGRCGPTHEFPGKDESYPEDTGSKARVYTIDGYIARRPGQDGVIDTRNALIAALDKPGPGELEHPNYGILQVQVRSWDAQASKERIGYIAVNMVFDLAHREKYPVAQSNPAGGMAVAAGNAHRQALENFAGNFVLDGMPDYLREKAVEAFAAVASGYERIARISGTSAAVGNLTNDLNSLAKEFQNLTDAAAMGTQLIAIPQAIAASFEEPWKNLRNSDGTFRGTSTMRGGGPISPDAVAVLVRAFNYGPDTVVPTYATASRHQQAANEAAIVNLTRQSAMIEAARLAPFVDWRTRQEAEGARDLIAEALDSQCVITASDPLYQALYDLRSLVLKTVPPEGGRLPSLVEYTPDYTLPALVLSYRLYGTIAKADELQIVNSLRHPGFIQGAEKLLILAEAAHA